MYRIYQVDGGERRLIGGARSLRDAQALVMRAAGMPLLDGRHVGGYRGPNEFLPRIEGVPRFEIVPRGAAVGAQAA